MYIYAYVYIICCSYSKLFQMLKEAFFSLLALGLQIYSSFDMDQCNSKVICELVGSQSIYDDIKRSSHLKNCFQAT